MYLSSEFLSLFLAGLLFDRTNSTYIVERKTDKAVTIVAIGVVGDKW